jgi:hypothetical protein
MQDIVIVVLTASYATRSVLAYRRGTSRCVLVTSRYARPEDPIEYPIICDRGDPAVVQWGEYHLVSRSSGGPGYSALACPYHVRRWSEN